MDKQHVFSRIDGAIVNAHWMMNMPPLQVCVMDPQFSDHSPLCIAVKAGMEYKGRPFKFFNCLTEHPEFEQIISRRWENENRNMKDIWCNLKQIKEEMKSLNKRAFSNTTKKVQKLRENLANIQAQMRTTNTAADMFDVERNTKHQLEKWSNIEESIYKQRSRI
ncbi:uncharacterized protein [Nicotiana sylvestris]|uniref:uncharacterized protein n=1 Tax=Nicotiana sylvestris TaxID=4096 RepID=UPI00388C489F